MPNLRCATLVSVAITFLPMLATSTVQAQTYSVIDTLNYMPDGAQPNALIQDAEGNLYGTARTGGTFFCLDNMFTCGAVFKVDSSGNETVLYTFKGGTDGALPLSSLIRDASGNLYGNTEGDGNFGDSSTIFELDPSGNETVLYDFEGQEGCCQDSPLALDEAGNIYGSSPYGGDLNCGYERPGCGSLYRLTQTGHFKLIHTFTGADGIQPEGGLIVDKNSLYGSAILGGNLSCLVPVGEYGVPQGCGTIFQVDSKGKLTVLHTFTDQADGGAPLGLIQDPTGNLYGIAEYGGDLTCDAPVGCGTIFKVDTTGHFSVLFTFTSADIPEPGYASHLVRDAQGNLYGIAQLGGANSSGFLFKLASDGTFTNLFSLPGTENVEDGSNPQGIVMDSSGNFFGSMLMLGQENGLCGPQGCGTLFKITF